MKRNVLVAGVIAGVVAACSEPAAELAGDAMVNAGEAMGGMSGELDDAGMDTLADAAAGIGSAMAGVGGMLGGGAGGAAGTGGAGRDGGNVAGDGDAQAQPAGPMVLTGACDVESGYHWVADATGAIHESKQFYADFDVSGMEVTELAGASFVLCDYETFGTGTAAACPASGYTCTTIGEPRPTETCFVQGLITVSGNTASVSCGYRSETGMPGATAVSGYRYNSVRLVIL